MNMDEKEDTHSLSFVQRLARKNEHFFASTWGQRLLLILAPFILLPNPQGPQNNQLQALFERLRTGLWSPLLGSFFFVSSLVVTLKAYQNLGVHFDWFLEIGSGKFLSVSTLLLALGAYNAAFARWVSPYMGRLLARDPHLPAYSLHFWTIRYGGLLMFSGLVGWLFTAVTWLSLPFWAFLTLFALLLLFVYIARKEIGFQNQKLYAKTPTRHTALLRVLEVASFSIATGLEVFLYFAYSPFLQSSLSHTS